MPEPDLPVAPASPTAHEPPRIGQVTPLALGPGREPGDAAADPIKRLLRFPTVRRLLLVALFVGLLLLFRKLLVLMVFFVAFERSIGTLAEQVVKRARIPRAAAVAAVALGLLAVMGAALGLGAGRAVHAGLELRHTLPDRIAAFRETDLYNQLQDRLQDAGRIIEGAQHYAGGALEYLATVGHVLLYALIGFILAVVYLLERDELDAFAGAQDARSIGGTLLRWMGHVADAVSVTLQFQVVVAAVNAVLTFPVLLLVGIPHATAFLFMVFFSGMVPVVGNFVAGAILTLLAYQAKRWVGVAIFTGLTFVLHKLESYYLNPRLASRHVRLPGFVLIVSLLLWEQLAGFAGLFISFPFLFIANRIRSEFRAEDDADADGTPPAPR
jgi:predicted PurR-regulated permease PerM